MSWLQSEQRQAARGKRTGRDDCLSRYCCSLNETLCPWEKRESRRVGGRRSAPGPGPGLRGEGASGNRAGSRSPSQCPLAPSHLSSLPSPDFGWLPLSIAEPLLLLPPGCLRHPRVHGKARSPSPHVERTSSR